MKQFILFIVFLSINSNLFAQNDSDVSKLQFKNDDNYVADIWTIAKPNSGLVSEVTAFFNVKSTNIHALKVKLTPIYSCETSDYDPEEFIVITDFKITDSELIIEKFKIKYGGIWIVWIQDADTDKLIAFGKYVAVYK